MKNFLLPALALLALTACAGTTPVTPVAPTTSVSFKADVAPLLTAKCAGCHTPGGQGSGDLVIFDAAGAVVHANVAADAADVVEQTRTGKMPRMRSALTAAEVGVLQKWQQDGAKDD